MLKTSSTHPTISVTKKLYQLPYMTSCYPKCDSYKVKFIADTGEQKHLLGTCWAVKKWSNFAIYLLERGAHRKRQVGNLGEYYLNRNQLKVLEHKLGIKDFSKENLKSKDTRKKIGSALKKHPELYPIIPTNE